MEEKKKRKKILTKQLYHFMSDLQMLSILSTILAAISAFVALVPFIYLESDAGSVKESDLISQRQRESAPMDGVR